MNLSVKGADNYEGWLYKWTNYIKGYQRRWFVVHNGRLSYYRNQAEVSQTCRGTINLANAHIQTGVGCNFTLTSGNAQTFHLRASTEVERQRWVTALELARTKAASMPDSDDDDDEVTTVATRQEMQTMLETLTRKLEDLRTCTDLLGKQQSSLQRSLADVEQAATPAELAQCMKGANERATVFRVTCNAALNACGEYHELAVSQAERWLRMQHQEHEQRARLETMVEQLAKQQCALEQRALRAQSPPGGVVGAGPPPYRQRTGGSSDEEEDEMFEDAVGEADQFSLSSKDGGDVKVTVKNGAEGEGREVKAHADVTSVANGNAPAAPAGDSYLVPYKKGQPRRKLIPANPNLSINLWSIMKNCIGRDLSRIPVPVNFGEPLSFLQRLTEDFEYSSILDAAAAATDSCEQMAYVVAYTVCAYATTTTRTGKPFNPLLGETFECDRTEELGWRSICEQVSHHPPTAAIHAEGQGWTSWQEFTMSSKFRGKYLQIIPLGIAHLLFGKTNNHYTWRKVTTTVHNIIVGRLWVDNHGEMDITNHTTGDKCHIKYAPYSYFSRDVPRKVTGVISDSTGRVRWLVQGTWDEKMEGAPVIFTENVDGNVVHRTGEKKLLWQRRYPPPELEACYHFTEFAVTLNEMEVGVAPTDSRFRPDQRYMEQARWDDANVVKVQLEDKQRAARRKLEQETTSAAEQGLEVASYEPRWFKKGIDSITGNPIHLYNNEYWQCKEKQDWSRCPDIYL